MQFDNKNKSTSDSETNAFGEKLSGRRLPPRGVSVEEFESQTISKKANKYQGTYHKRTYSQPKRNTAYKTYDKNGDRDRKTYTAFTPAGSTNPYLTSKTDEPSFPTSFRGTLDPDSQTTSTLRANSGTGSQRFSKTGKYTYKLTQNENSGYKNERAEQKNTRANANERISDTDREEKSTNHRNVRRGPLRIIPLGGLHEIGKNMTVFEYGNDIFIVDVGMSFPDADMPGVDIVLPDFSYVEENIDRVRGIVITHGHEDHIGALPYLMKKVNIPVYGTRLTLGLINGKFSEHNIKGVEMNEISPRQTVRFGCMAVEFIKVNHSIPGSVALAIHTPVGIVVHTGDFKVDYTPVEGGVIDLARFGELGSKGVLALMADSTNAERSGHTASERIVGASFEKLFDKADGKRIIIATFSSNIQRIQQIINHAIRCQRKVTVLGRSMINVINIATELGYLKVPDGVIIDIDEIERYPSDKIVLITTGSQGEPMSALTRMAMNEHKSVSISSEDFIIISATPIPGNEKLVTKVVNNLLKSGAEVVYEAMYDVHVSGHACQEELKLIQALTKPKFFIPVHGEYKHLKKHAALATSMGMSEKNVIIAQNGSVIETDGTDMKITDTVTAGRILVDGYGVGDVGSIVLRDRRILAQDGLIVVILSMGRGTNEILGGPDIVSRGFIYVRESEEFIESAKELVTRSVNDCLRSGNRDWSSLKFRIKDDLGDYIYMKTKRSPMILPVIEEIDL